MNRSFKPYQTPRPVHRPKILRLPDDGGPIQILDCTIYRARRFDPKRPNKPLHGKLGNHYTQDQLEKAFHEAGLMRQHGIPLLDTHFYGDHPIGRLKKWWFTDDGWLHAEAEIFDRKTLGPQLYEHFQKLIRSGQLTDISLSMIQMQRPDGTFDPNDLRLQEVSICRVGRHKNCNIRVVEASDPSQSGARVVHHKGKLIRSNMNGLEITHEGGKGLNTAHLSPSLEDLVAQATECGVAFTQAELDEYAARQGSENQFSAAVAIMAKMAEQNLLLSRENKGMRPVVEQLNASYVKQREQDVAMVEAWYQAKVADKSLNEETAKELIEAAKAMGADRDQSRAFDAMISGIAEATKMREQYAEAQKQAEKARNAENRARRAARDQSPKRQLTAPQQAAKKAAEPAKPPAAEQAKRDAIADAILKGAVPKNPNAVAPADAHEVPAGEGELPDPAAMASEMIPVVASTGYTKVEASADHGDLPWINKEAPLAYQGSYAQHLPSESMRRITEIMTAPNYFDNSLNCNVPPPGQQGFIRHSFRPAY